MPVKSDREYRAIPLTNMELRKADDDKCMVEGYASTFEEYELWNDGDISYREIIDQKAFDEADMSDVIFQKDHQGTVFARTSNGTISIDIDDHGLHQRTDLGKTTSARQMYEEIDAGMYTQMSFAFTVAEDSYTYNRELKTYTRKITKIKKVYDISAVSFPANPGTDIGVSARSLFAGVIEREAEELRKVERQKQKIRILCEVNK